VEERRNIPGDLGPSPPEDAQQRLGEELAKWFCWAGVRSSSIRRQLSIIFSRVTMFRSGKFTNRRRSR
jgi:hypothetical protein